MNTVVRTQRRTVVAPTGAPETVVRPSGGGSQGIPGPPGLANSAFATRNDMATYAPGGGIHVGDNFFLSEAGREGSFVVDLASSWTAAIAADATQKGLFVPSTFDATKVYRRVFQGRAVSLWWGVSPSNSASANVAAYNNAISVLEALAVDTTGSGYGYNKGGYPLYTPAGIYQFDSELTTQHAAIQHFGDFTGGIGGGGGTVFKWTSATTHGFNFISNNSGSNSSGSAVRGFWLQGAYDYTTGTRGAYHAVNFTGIITIEDCWASNWPGCGYKGFANIATNPGTQVSNSFFRHIGAQFCDWAMWLDGGDANTCTGLDVSGVANRFGNIKDTSGLGNQWTGGQCEGNGNDPRYHIRCHQGGHIYAVAYGQEAGASTNAPPGTATNNPWWIYLYDGSANTTQPTWASGQTWYFGAPLGFDPTNGSQHSVGVGIYLEDYNPVIMGVRCKLVPGGFDGSIMRFFTGTGAPHGGVILSGSDSGAELLLNGGLQAPAGIHGFGTDHSFGPQSGAAADSATYLDHTNFSSFLYFRHWASGTPTLFAHIQGQSAAGLFYDVNSGLAHNFSVNGAAVAAIGSGGIDLASGKFLSVNGTQVVGARQTGTPADATDLATALTLINALKAKLITHGLIS